MQLLLLVASCSESVVDGDLVRNFRRGRVTAIFISLGLGL